MAFLSYYTSQRDLYLPQQSVPRLLQIMAKTTDVDIFGTFILDACAPRTAMFDFT